MNYTFLLFICLQNYTFSLFSYLQNYTFLYFDYLKNYTFLYFDYLQNYTFSLFLSLEVFCRLISESGGMAKLKTRGRRVEVSRGVTSERFAPKTFYGAGSSRGQSIFRDAETSRGREGSKICATLHTKRKTAEKYKKEPRARRAYSPFIPIRFSRVHTFPPNPTQLGFKV